MGLWIHRSQNSYEMVVIEMIRNIVETIIIVWGQTFYIFLSLTFHIVPQVPVFEDTDLIFWKFPTLNPTEEKGITVLDQYVPCRILLIINIQGRERKGLENVSVKVFTNT